MQVETINCQSRDKYPKKNKSLINYGTAGFRTIADDLDCIMFRMGLLACLRSSHKKAAIGIIITASHNPVEDNGIKLIDPMGQMLAIDWESHATMLANASDSDVVSVLEEITKTHEINLRIKPIIFIGRDTRPSCQRLFEAVISGAKTFAAEIRDFGVVSTPLIHFTTACYNGNERYGKPTESSYLEKLTEAFSNLHNKNNGVGGSYKPIILFDGANGVGADMMTRIKPFLAEKLDIKMFNSGKGVLNFMCGADYVKTTQSWPNGVPRERNIRCVSVDGDADRIIYSYLNENGEFVMLDGDKIGTLIIGYLQKLLKLSDINLNLGLVQTAYANGSATKYIETALRIPVTCVKTGVKYLHEAALEYDIGVYFEANGHGTIIFSEFARESIINKAKDENAIEALELLYAMNLINETVGDAISDMLLVESILQSYGWSEKEWNETYTDLPNRIMKVKVSDRSVIETTDAERICTKPVGLQEEIDSIIERVLMGRAFVRPSGTEDVVRIYAEAATHTSRDFLVQTVAIAVYDMAGGVGEKLISPEL